MCRDTIYLRDRLINAFRLLINASMFWSLKEKAAFDQSTAALNRAGSVSSLRDRNSRTVVQGTPTDLLHLPSYYLQLSARQTRTGGLYDVQLASC